MTLARDEYGGVGMEVPGHEWVAGRVVGDTKMGSATESEDRHAEFDGQVQDFRDKQGMRAAIFTQIPDTEIEITRLLTYDRAPEIDLGRIARANRFQLPPHHLRHRGAQYEDRRA